MWGEKGAMWGRVLRVERVLCGGERCFVWRECYVRGERCCVESAGKRVLCGESAMCVSRVLCGRRRVLCVERRVPSPSCVDAEEFMGCFLDGLHEEMVAACQAVTTVAGNEPGDKAG